MTSATGNRGFTLIEILVSIVLLSVALVWILEGYGTILNATRRSQVLTDGSLLLHEKMAEREIAIRTGEEGEGKDAGEEGVWEWSTEVKESEQEDWYELAGEVRRKGRGGGVSQATYVPRYRK